MHIATHNWMRPESIKRTIERMRETGVDALEISGEPDQYDPKEVRKLLADNGRKCWGSVTLTLGERNLAANERRATREDRRLHEARGHAGQGARRPDHHDGAGHGRQGGGRRHARPGMEVAGRRHQGGLCARREGRHPHCHRAAEPLRDLSHQPRRPGARPGRCGRPELRRVPGPVPHEHRGKRHPRRLPQVQGPHLRHPHRRQQPLRTGHGHAGLPRHRRDHQGRRLRRRADAGIRRHHRPHAGQSLRRPGRDQSGRRHARADEVHHRPRLEPARRTSSTPGCFSSRSRCCGR